MASSICLPKIGQALQIVSRALFKLGIVWQITKGMSVFLHTTYFKGREMQLQATFLYSSTASCFHIQGEQKGLADPNVN